MYARLDRCGVIGLNCHILIFIVPRGVQVYMAAIGLQRIESFVKFPNPEEGHVRVAGRTGVI